MPDNTPQRAGQEGRLTQEQLKGRLWQSYLTIVCILWWWWWRAVKSAEVVELVVVREVRLRRCSHSSKAFFLTLRPKRGGRETARGRQCYQRHQRNGIAQISSTSVSDRIPLSPARKKHTLSHRLTCLWSNHRPYPSLYKGKTLLTGHGRRVMTFASCQRDWAGLRCTEARAARLHDECTSIRPPLGNM